MIDKLCRIPPTKRSCCFSEESMFCSDATARRSSASASCSSRRSRSARATLSCSKKGQKSFVQLACVKHPAGIHVCEQGKCWVVDGSHGPLSGRCRRSRSSPTARLSVRRPLIWRRQRSARWLRPAFVRPLGQTTTGSPTFSSSCFCCSSCFLSTEISCSVAGGSSGSAAAPAGGGGAALRAAKAMEQCPSPRCQTP